MHMVYPKPLEVTMAHHLIRENLKDYLDIDHKKGILYWPQSDSEVERLDKTLLKSIKISEFQDKEWKSELQNFLFQYRNTPHTSESCI